MGSKIQHHVLKYIDGCNVQQSILHLIASPKFQQSWHTKKEVHASHNTTKSQIWKNCSASQGINNYFSGAFLIICVTAGILRRIPGWYASLFFPMHSSGESEKSGLVSFKYSLISLMTRAYDQHSSALVPVLWLFNCPRLMFLASPFPHVTHAKRHRGH